MSSRVLLCAVVLVVSGCANSNKSACGDVIKSSEIATAQSKLLNERGDVRQGAAYRVIIKEIILNNSQCFSPAAVAEAKLRLGR